jgi:protein Mpv17
MLLARLYQQAFDSRPYLTLATANGLLSSFADCIAQSSQILLTPVHQHKPEYDSERTTRFLVFGILMGNQYTFVYIHSWLILGPRKGPFIGRWNKILEVTFPLTTHGRSQVSLAALAKRVLSDQLFM